MSHFVECQTEFKDPEALVAALLECGFSEEQIEVHTEATQLYGYQGDVRLQKAHIVIRREHVGTAANDVGWECQGDGTYRAWISEYDGRHRFKPEMQNRIKQEYAFQVMRAAATIDGPIGGTAVLIQRRIELTLGGYR